MTTKKDKLPDYWGDEKVAADFVKKRIEAMKENPDRTEILSRAEESEKEVYRFLSVKSGSSNWEFETFIAHAAVMHMLSEQETTKFELRPTEDNDADYSSVVKEMLLYGQRKCLFDMNDFMCKFAAHIHGIAFSFDGWRTEHKTGNTRNHSWMRMENSRGKLRFRKKRNWSMTIRSANGFLSSLLFGMSWQTVCMIRQDLAEREIFHIFCPINLSNQLNEDMLPAPSTKISIKLLPEIS